jgi:hypothetical protein
MAQSNASISNPPAMSVALWHCLQFSAKNGATPVGGAATRVMERTKRTTKNDSTILTRIVDGCVKNAISGFSKILQGYWR